MNNAKLTYPEMKELLDLFTRLKLNALKVGDFEVQKNHYETDVPSDKKTSFQEDSLFYSAPALPLEIQETLAAMMTKK